jgi:hypothetical protein
VILNVASDSHRKKTKDFFEPEMAERANSQTMARLDASHLPSKNHTGDAVIMAFLNAHRGGKCFSIRCLSPNNLGFLEDTSNCQTEVPVYLDILDE